MRTSVRSGIAAIFMLFLLAALAAAASAQEQEKDATATLPLKRIVLFNAGVGFFEHAGPVRGTAEAEFQFHVEDINDLLKSMVVQDLGGRISTVSYASKDPIAKTLRSFAIDLTENPTLADLLNQVRGQRVALEVPDKLTGMIVGVEKKKRKVAEDEVIEVDMLNLLGDEGLRWLPLDTVNRIQFLDEKVDAEFRKALALLATARATDKKIVTLKFQGEGEREVRVGYIQEAPVWKTSYRLVLDKDKPPFLQGWAIVENTTESDWTDVDLTLVSGRPISFTMDLYEPLYVPRPEEQLELYASLRPQRYEQDLAQKEKEFVRKAEVAMERQAAAPPSPGAPAAARARRAGEADRMGLAGAYAVEAKQADKKMDLGRGVQAVATAGEVGELFRYDIGMPVTLPRQQSAMLPIVNQEVKGEKLSIYNSSVHPKHPLNGVRLTNSTDLHLMQGPITVFDDSVYAGDAMINDLPPGSERLISYAMDLNLEVAAQTKSQPDQIVSLRLVKGTMLITRKFHRAVEHTLKNSGDEAKKVLLEYPVTPDWTLLEPKEPAEKTRDQYRFAVEAKPGETARLTVEEERIERQQLALTNLDDNAIQMYLSAPSVSEAAKKALAEVARQRHEIAQVSTERGQLEQQIQAITQEQTRIRENMRQLDRTSELYKRYVKKFDEQEDQIEQLRGKIQELQAKENELRKALDEYLMGLDVQ